MRKTVLFGCLLASTLSATEYGVLGYYFVDPDRPVHVAGRYRQIGAADFKNHAYGDVKYADGYAAAIYTHFIDQLNENSLSWGVGYDYLKFNWPDNPRFDEKNFQYGTFSLGYVSTTLERWRWIVNGGVSVDASHLNFGLTGVYHGMLWGRYHFTDNLGAHVGMMGWYGVMNGYGLPIFGLDWRWKNWTVNAIFPLNFSLNYAMTENWSVELAYSGFGGPYRYPRRAFDGKPGFRDPIFEVYSSGVDLSLRYTLHHLVRVDLGAGWNGGGWILIKNHENHHGQYYHYKSAAYGQGTLAFTF
jgi:hypothetical protein